VNHLFHREARAEAAALRLLASIAVSAKSQSVPARGAFTPNASHFPQLDNPAAFNAVVAEFLAE
jgi:pimeloyl-ACP methyl ester carboxylesterase